VPALRELLDDLGPAQRWTSALAGAQPGLSNAQNGHLTVQVDKKTDLATLQMEA
jgi:hypothetical protein